MTTVLTQIVATTLPPVAFGMLKALLRLRKPHTQDAYSQTALNTVFTNPDFNLALRAAQTMNVIFLIIMYSAGMPILNLIGAGYCFFSFWIDKWVLLRYAKKPPQYNDMLVRKALKMMPYAVLLHMGIGCWTFANNLLFPSDFITQSWADSYGERFAPYTDDLDRIRSYGSKNMAELRLMLEERLWSLMRNAAFYHFIV